MGAELATALAVEAGHGYIYIVEPSGVFEADPNLTNKALRRQPESFLSHAPTLEDRRRSHGLDRAPAGDGARNAQ